MYNVEGRTTASTTEAAGSHSHSGNTNPTGAGASYENRPRYYKLAFIMKL